MNKGSAKTYFHFLLLSDSYNNIAMGSTSLYTAGITALEIPCTINEKSVCRLQSLVHTVSYIIISDS